MENITKKEIEFLEQLAKKSKRLKPSASAGTGLSEKVNFAIDKTKPPYNDKGKTNFNIRNKAGVYLIYKSKKLVYVGFSQKDVYKALYRHFQYYNDIGKQQRVYFDDLKNITVRVVYCKNSKQALKLEQSLILKYKPKLNENTYDEFIMDKTEKDTLKEFNGIYAGSYNSEQDLPF